MSDFISREAAIAIATSREGHAKGETARACRGIAVSLSMMPAAPAVKVKPLEWRDCTDGTSHDDGCLYEVEKDGKFWRVLKAVTGGGRYVCHAATLEAAKAAVQSHHEARILAALESQK